MEKETLNKLQSSIEKQVISIMFIILLFIIILTGYFVHSEIEIKNYTLVHAKIIKYCSNYLNDTFIIDDNDVLEYQPIGEFKLNNITTTCHITTNTIYDNKYCKNNINLLGSYRYIYYNSIDNTCITVNYFGLLNIILISSCLFFSICFIIFMKYFNKKYHMNLQMIEENSKEQTSDV